MEFTEQLTLTSLRTGDITAFEMLFRTHYQPLCNYAYTFVQDRDEAEEIVQSTFLSVWEKRENLEIRTAVKPYLYAMVRNACLNVLKHEKVKQQHAAVEMAVAEKSVESVTRTVIASELETRIYDAMEKLPQQCRLIFKLSRFEELKYSEIADQLDLSIKTVENQMGKALKIMREQLKDYLPLLIVLMNGFLN
ncbi:RNA polymerase sigma-70 factor [Ohtaekwangia koreensis]|uniref:RNA polymerase sigma-70 factor, ECF subfamily n=1 Tax=Ohtaekwangia koreensis TaxID=688867 RepID=A0A1T5LLD1_9BACT|nr:RNA polymerase sigma-70 factor [Ohtaekwangia koreensis]SKC76720.1 RNA polymerase sigma-70 factor, ECF subfamily [Ohtaekwangia koreensis]